MSYVYSKYGDKFESDTDNGGYYIYGDSCPYIYFHNAYDLNPSRNNLIVGVGCSEEGVELFNGVCIGDTEKEIEQKLKIELSLYSDENGEYGDDVFISWSDIDKYKFNCLFDKNSLTLVYADIVLIEY